MKKQLIAVLLAAGFSMSAGLASAATAFQTNSEVTTTACTLLAENVTLGVSSKVHGAWACDETLNLVQVAACHEGDSRSGVTCTATPALDENGAIIPDQFTYQAGCNAELAAAGAQSPIPSYGAFFASSAGGVMVQQPLDGRCSATSIVGVEGF